jgi:hypothetical protein
VERTWKPTAAGILCIIAGVLCVIPAIVVGVIFTPIGAALAIMAIVPIVGGIFALRRRIWGLALAGAILTLIDTVIVGIFLAVFWVIAFLVTLGGSVDNPGATPISLDPLSSGFIVGFAILLTLGILAIIFVIKGKREFR